MGVLLIGGRPEDNSAGWADSFLAHLRDAFAGLGLRAIHARINESDKSELSSALRCFADDGADFFTVDINGRNTLPNVPAFALVVDHPLTHPHLSRAEPTTVLGTIDAGHVHLDGYSPAPSYFLPHGGPAGVLGLPEDERPIDVLFCGGIPLDGCAPPESFLQGWDETARVIVVEAVEMLEARGGDPFPALLDALAYRSLSLADIDQASFVKMLSFLTLYSQCVLRTALLEKMRGLAVTVLGPVANDVRTRLGENVTYGGSCGFDVFLDHACRSKIVLNASHKFPQGSHERIWYGMAAGACVLTNRSDYVQRTFSDGDNILLYDLDNVDSERLRDLIHTGETCRMADAAQPIYLRHHTWRHRAEDIVQIMRAHPA